MTSSDPSPAKPGNDTWSTSSASKSTEHAAAPRTTNERLLESLNDRPLELSSLIEDAAHASATSRESVLYLAYGSNLSRATFRGRRKINPISQVNVVVPQLSLTFSLPGLPYKEPCFANTKAREPPTRSEDASLVEGEAYHKDTWHKGLVGAVYEVTRADYARIIATEGGGASYEDVVVNCHALAEDPTMLVPAIPSGTTFKAHTLSAPINRGSQGGRPLRPDPSYAQPSPRYLKLITDGAGELTLPYEYQEFLRSIRPYRVTNPIQGLGKSIFTALWWPLVMCLFAAGRKFADPQGRYPPWLATISTGIFKAMWASYDYFFKICFGDGERTIESECRPSHLTREQEQPLLGSEKKPILNGIAARCESVDNPLDIKRERVGN